MLFDSTKKVENAIYIYIVLVFCATCSTLLFFAIREGFARRSSKGERTQAVLKETVEQNDHETQVYSTEGCVLERPPAVANYADPPAEMQDFEVGSETEWATIAIKHNPDKEKVAEKKLRSQSSFDEPQVSRHSQSHQPEKLHSGSHHSGSQENSSGSKYSATPSGKSQTRKPRIVFQEEELRSLEPGITSLAKSTSVQLSKLLSPRLLHTKSPIPNEYVMTSELHDIRTWLSDPSHPTKTIALVRLVHACAFQEPFDNIHHFHSDFCDVIVDLVDTLNIYSFSYNFHVLQVMLVDLAALVAWEHWNWSWGSKFAPTAKQAPNSQPMSLVEAIDTGYRSHMENESTHTSQAEAFNGYGCSAVLSDITVFRLLCNLYLGSPALAKEIRADSLFKLGSVFTACAKNTRCHQQKALVTLVSQAVVSTTRESIRAFFYAVLADILRPHLFCCLEPDDVFSAESEIQQLVFRGLWTDQPPMVREKTAEVVAVLGERFPEAATWTKSMKFVGGRHDSSGRSGAPGSWSDFA